MAIESMTGFAHENGASGPWRFSWDIRSVNSKSLEIKLRLAPPLEDFGEEARRIVGNAIKRGTISLVLSVSRETSAIEARINEPLLAQLAKSAQQAALRSGLPAPTLDALLAVRGVVELVEASDDDAEIEALRIAAGEALRRGLAVLTMARQREGDALLPVLRARVAEILDLARRAEICPGRQPEAIRARLAQAIALLVENGPSLDPARLHQEAILIAAKADIREEIDRLLAHAEAADKLITDGGAVGRKLDFLCQELSREANTLCAKSNDIELTAIGLELKSVIEQLREQVQNIA